MLVDVFTLGWLVWLLLKANNIPNEKMVEVEHIASLLGKLPGPCSKPCDSKEKTNIHELELDSEEQ